MKAYKGYVTLINKETSEVTIQFEQYDAVKKIMDLPSDMPIGIAFHKWKEERSLAQNNFLWACIGEIAKATHSPDRWQIYLELLKRYGQFDHLLLLPESVETFKKICREVEVLGDYTTQSGQRMKQVRVYYGSHTYDTAEMANLLTGTLDEMKLLGIKPKLSQEDKERYGL